MYYTYSYENLKSFCEEAFKKFGFTDHEAWVITDVLLLADLYGIESHGTSRLVKYHKDIEKGLVRLDAKPETVFETPVSAVIDAHDGMGQLVAYKAMEMAIEKAKKTGIAFVAVRNSTHYGIAGYYAKMASDQGLMGFSTTNTTAIMIPTFGSKAMLGSNPLAFACPADPYPFLFDASTSVITRGKVEVYHKKNKPLHDGWAMDSNGVPCNDAFEVFDCILKGKGGGILPLGGYSEESGSHKGYGFGMIAELLSSIVSLGDTSNKTNKGGHSGICHGFMAIDPAIFGDAQAIRQHLSNYLEDLRQSPKAKGQDTIYTHGQKEILAMEERMKSGIQINENTLAEMRDLGLYLGMDVVKFLGEQSLKAQSGRALYKA